MAPGLVELIGACLVVPCVQAAWAGLRKFCDRKVADRQTGRQRRRSAPPAEDLQLKWSFPGLTQDLMLSPAGRNLVNERAFFPLRDGRMIFYQTWRPPGVELVAVVVHFHGFALNTDDHNDAPLARALCVLGNFAVVDFKIAGTNAEVMPGQWEYQIGPCLGVEIGDHMMLGRYLLQRVAEDFQVDVSFAPKLFPDWNGSGAHTNFSTLTMRNGDKGMDYISQMMKRFEAKHSDHIAVYGDDNAKRLTGLHETSSCQVFSSGIGNRAASFRIPTSTAAANGKGYIEDRRPASNIDPYVVGALIADTGILDESLAAEMLAHYKKWHNWRVTADIPGI